MSAEVIHITQVVTAYWVVSISMVYLNKILLSNEEASISAPMFVTWYQCVITAAICVVLGNLGESSRKEGRQSFLNEYPRVKYNMETGLKVLPLSVIFVGMIAFNNICLKYVEVSFYNVARSLSIVFNVIFTYYLLGKGTSLKTCSTLTIVILGFYLGIDGEINLSIFGTLAGVLSSLFVSLNSIYTSKVLPAVNNDKSLLLYYNNVNAAFLFLPFIILFEAQV
jgi:GDP-fucose transporter C1